MKSKLYKRRVVLSLFLLLGLLVLGPRVPAAGQAKLSLSEATTALTRMVSEKDWDKVPHARPVPPADQFKQIKGESSLSCSPWSIDPEQRTFVFTLSHKDGGIWQRSGTFVLNDQRKWQAKVEKEVRAHGPPSSASAGRP